MKLILLVIACIAMLILATFLYYVHTVNKTTQLVNKQSKATVTIFKDSYSYLPNEARMCGLIY